MNWMQWVQFGLALATQIIDLIKKAEVEIPGPAKGEEKKAFVQGSAALATTLAGGNEDQVAAVVDATGKVIDSTVAILNATGTFKQRGAQ